MVQTLTARAVFIVTIFSAFGIILKKLIEVSNASFGTAAVSMILSLMASLILSLFLISRLTMKRINRFILISLALFLIAFWSFYLFQLKFNNGTVILEEFKGDTTALAKYFKGTKYTTNALKFLKLYPEYRDDDVGLVRKFENKPENVWTQASIRNLELSISLFYFLFVIAVSSCLSLTAEILTRRRQEQLTRQTDRSNSRRPPPDRKAPRGETE